MALSRLLKASPQLLRMSGSISVSLRLDFQVRVKVLSGTMVGFVSWLEILRILPRVPFFVLGFLGSHG